MYPWLSWNSPCSSQGLTVLLVLKACTAILILLVFEARPHCVAQPNFELQSSCLRLLSVGVIGMCCQARFVFSHCLALYPDPLLPLKC